MVTYPSTHGVFEDTHHRHLRLGARRRRPGLRRRRQPQRARRPGPARAASAPTSATSTCTRPSASRTAAAAPASARSAVRAHLAPYLPNHPLDEAAGPATGPGPVSAAPYGSAGILPISWAYVRLMGGEGLTRATQVAVLNANYVAHRLQPHFPVLYTGRGGLVAHECIVDLRGDHQGDRRDGRRRRQAADRLRLPRPDDELPGRRDADDRADRERGPGRARPVLRRDDRDPQGDRRGRRRHLAGRRQPAARGAAHRGVPDGGVGPAVRPGDGGLPGRQPRGRASTGRRCGASTGRSATATWSARARRCRRTRAEPGSGG